MKATTKNVVACAPPTKGGMAWHEVDWAKVQNRVKSLQVRIAKATKEGRWNKVKALQHLIAHSLSAKLLAVRRVTENSGSSTPGVDGETWSTPAEKMEAALSLKERGYHPQPLRRVHIPKKNGKKRPLGIPTMHDRAMQALYLLALEPVAETTGDQNSYGFRKGRCTADAMEQLYCDLAKHQAPQWVLEGDIKGCFDNISHDWLERKVPMDRKILHKWLKAGFVEHRRLFPTNAGTPQGGIISPVLANMALDGLEVVVRNNLPDLEKRVYSKVHVVRYADDFVITGSSQEQLRDEVLPLVRQFMGERGLELSEEKTKITHIEDGFDFLGWNFRKYDGKLLIKPSKNNVKGVLGKIRGLISAKKTAKQENLIGLLNPVIRGWAQYHRGAVAAETFKKVDDKIWKALWKWARRRHPNQGKKWVVNRYFHTIGGRNWVFSAITGKGEATKTMKLLKMADFKIKRHVKVRSEVNPFDPKWEAYFEARETAKMLTTLEGRRRLLAVWNRTKGVCLICQDLISEVRPWVLHHQAPTIRGGKDVIANEVLLHANCHNGYHWKHGLETGPIIP